MKKSLMIASLAAVLGAPLGAYAFGLPSLPGVPGVGQKTEAPAAQSSSEQGADPAVAQDQLVQAYVAANRNVLQSQAQMADALGLKQEAAKAQAAADALSSGATTDGLKDTEVVKSDVSKAITAKLADTAAPALTDESRKQFVAGMVYLAKGALGYAKLKDNLATFKNSMSALSPMQLGLMTTKLGAGLYVAKTAPESGKNVFGALTQAVSFAKSQGIPVPADATSATAAI